MRIINIWQGTGKIHHSFLRKFLYCLLSAFFLCSSLTWCSLSFSWMNSLWHASHFTIGWWWMCLAWAIRSSYFANFSPHWSQTSSFPLLWRMPKLFLYKLKSITIKRFYSLRRILHRQSALCCPNIWMGMQHRWYGRPDERESRWRGCTCRLIVPRMYQDI